MYVSIEQNPVLEATRATARVVKITAICAIIILAKAVYGYVLFRGYMSLNAFVLGFGWLMLALSLLAAVGVMAAVIMSGRR